MSMTESEATREMTFDEEYEILQAETNELFSKENDNEEPPFANCVIRRALRCIRKLKEEREQYKAIGTVSEFRENKNFLEFLCNTIPPNEMERYLAMYHASEEKGE